MFLCVIGCAFKFFFSNFNEIRVCDFVQFYFRDTLLNLFRGMVIKKTTSMCKLKSDVLERQFVERASNLNL